MTMFQASQEAVLSQHETIQKQNNTLQQALVMQDHNTTAFTQIHARALTIQERTVDVQERNVGIQEKQLDYAKDPDRRRSVTGAGVFLEGAPISTICHMQNSTTLSVTESELVSGKKRTRSSIQ